ncbi:MAG: rhomboid family intramembrane serine protease [Planctomycetota bacterium]
MIPLRDNIPSRTTPVVVYALIAINVLMFLLQLSAGERFTFSLGVKPGFLLAWVQGEPATVRQAVHTIYGDRLTLVEVEATFANTILPFFTSMFLHGGWLHLGFNMLYLWVFADNIEDQLGRRRFIAFYLLSGIAASAVHVLFDHESVIPTVGASGAIAGVLGAYIVRFPRARVLTLIPIFFFIHFVEIPAFFFLGFWFLVQIFKGLSGTGGNIAVWAHAGGFVAGILLFKLLARSGGAPPGRGPYRDVPFEVIR